MIYYLTNGVLCYAKRSTKQTIYAGVQENGCRNHEKRTSEYLCNDAGIYVNDHKIIERWKRIYLEEGPEGLAIERRGRSSKGRPPKQLPKQVEEDLLADAKRKGAEVVFTTGGAQSNHAMLTAACAKKLGMEPILILKKRGVTERKGNQLLEYLMDTDVCFMDTDSYDDIYAEMDRVGKAFAGLVKMAREGQFKPTDNVLYLYSGGAGGLFAIDIELD